MKILRIITLFLLISVEQASARDVITLANGEWAPFQSASLPEYGVTSYFVTKAFQKVNIDVKYKFYPWARCEMLAQAGEIDGAFVYAPSKERDQYFIYSDKVLQQDRFFFHRKDVKFAWRNFDELKGKKIGIIRGYIYGKDFDDAVSREIFSVEWVSTDTQNLAKVLKGWLDATPIDILVADRALQKDFTPRERAMITFDPKSVYQYNYTILFSKRLPNSIQMRARFNEGLKMLSAQIGENRLLHPCDNLNHLDKENLTSQDKDVIKASCQRTEKP